MLTHNNSDSGSRLTVLDSCTPRLRSCWIAASEWSTVGLRASKGTLRVRCRPFAWPELGSALFVDALQGCSRGLHPVMAQPGTGRTEVDAWEGDGAQCFRAAFEARRSTHVMLAVPVQGYYR